MPKLSIIVPIYNVEKYITQSLDSIMNQRFEDFEAILVDDGSPDRCGEIAEEYASRDSRFIVIHQNNQGLSAARNTGLKYARGEYIGTVDPDDWILPNMFYSLIEMAELHNVEIACCGWYVADDSGTIQDEHKIDTESRKIDSAQFFYRLFDRPRTIGSCVWSKIFRKDWITGQFSKEFSLSEDRLFLFEVGLNKRFSVGILDKSLYVYRRRQGSLTRLNILTYIPSLKVEEIVHQLCLKTTDVKLKKLSQNDYLDKCLELYNLYREKKCLEGEDVVTDSMKEYIQNHFLSIIKNDTINRNTRILYVMWYFTHLVHFRKGESEMQE